MDIGGHVPPLLVGATALMHHFFAPSWGSALPGGRSRRGLEFLDFQVVQEDGVGGPGVDGEEEFASGEIQLGLRLGWILDPERLAHEAAFDRQVDGELLPSGFREEGACLASHL